MHLDRVRRRQAQLRLTVHRRAVKRPCKLDRRLQLGLVELELLELEELDERTYLRATSVFRTVGDRDAEMNADTMVQLR